MSLVDINIDWQLRNSLHKVYYRKSFSLTELDHIVLTYLAEKDNTSNYIEMGLDLGFAVESDPLNNLFYDQSEEEVFDKILQTLERYHLIQINETETDGKMVSATMWGINALDSNYKYLFYEGKIKLNDLHHFHNAESLDNPFPYYKYGIHSEVQENQEVEPFLYQLEDKEANFFFVKALESCKGESGIPKDWHIGWVNPDIEKYEKLTIPLTLFLFNNEGNFHFKVAINGIESPELLSIVSDPENIKIYEEWLLRLKWVNYLKETDVIKAQDIAPYISLIDWKYFFKDDRIQWNTNLLDILTTPEVNNLEVWNAAIEYCPSEVIENSIARYFNNWNWSKLTNKLSADFIIANINDFPWDINLLCDSLNAKQLEKVLLSLDELEKLGELDNVVELVSDDFLRNNLKNFPFNLALITTWGEARAGELITSNPDESWDFGFIASNYTLPFIAKHLKVIGTYLDVNGLLKRTVKTKESFNNALKHPVIIDFVNSRAAELTLRIGAEDDIYLNEEVVSWLDNNDVLFWGTEKVPGVESNTCFRWSTQSFEKYKNKIRSVRAFENVSLKIQELRSVIANQSFEWNYKILSKRSDLDWSIQHISQLKTKLAFYTLIQRVDPTIISENISFFIDWATENENLEPFLEVISNRLSAPTLLDLLSILSTRLLTIDWELVLAKETETICDHLIDKHSIEISRLNDSNSILKAFSAKCSIEYILDHTEIQWDWRIVTINRISLEELASYEIQNEFKQYLFWPYVIKHMYSEKDLLQIDKLTTLAWYISHGEQSLIKESWAEITKKISSFSLWKIIDETSTYEIFHWDWDYISSNSKIPIDHSFLEKYVDSINWDNLSENRVLASFFQYNKSAYRNLNEWVNFIIEYLDTFKQKWNFARLSTINNLTWHERIVSEFEGFWDWSVLSRQSTLLTMSDRNSKEIHYDKRRFNRFSNRIDFGQISLRFDVILDSDLIENYIDHKWDWLALSSHPLLQINSDFVIRHSNKAWDYYQFTSSPSLNLDKELLLELPEKNWNWEHISNENWVDNDLVIQLHEKDWNLTLLCRNKNIILDKNLLEIFVNKEFSNWNLVLENNNLHITPDTVTLISNSQFFNSEHWKLLSKHSNLNFSEHNILLERFAKFWNWEDLVAQNKLDLSNIYLLRKFKSYLNWTSITNSESFNPSFEILEEFRDEFDWQVLSSRINLNRDTLRAFKDNLDWSQVSSNTSISFSKDLIEGFRNYWDYYFLIDNPAIPIDAREHIDEIIDSIPELQLYLKLRDDSSVWAGSVYHYTHVSNAIEIIKSGKILSRNRAKNHADAAGNVVLRRNDAHNYARFYFRPQTPTQFYNEALGKDINCGYYGWSKDYYGNWTKIWKSNFPQALALGLPKCPVPVFFKFDLQEIILKHKNQCFISNGNMQTNWATAGPIASMLPKFNFMDVYSTIKNTSDGDWHTYINYSQQEFLIPDEFDFSDLKNFLIIVPNSAVKRQLQNAIIPNSELSRKIIIDNYQYQVLHNENKKIEYQIHENEISIWTDYQGDGQNHGSIVLESDMVDSLEYISGNILSISNTSIIAYPNLKVKVNPKANISIKFSDDYKGQMWSIYKGSLDENEFQNSSLPEHPRINKDYPKKWSFDNPNLLLNHLMNLSSEIKDLFLKRVRHYFLKEHTLLVLNAYEKYFGSRQLNIEQNLFRVFLALHDIGKPIANEEGDKSDQYKYTQQIIKKYWNQLPFDDEDLKVALALSEGDYIGQYMQGILPLESTLSSLEEVAKKYNLELLYLAELYSVYYQSDIAAYTQDDGGIKFLENLFHYQNGMKLIDPESGFIRLSSDHWMKFLELQRSIAVYDRV